LPYDTHDGRDRKIQLPARPARNNTLHIYDFIASIKKTITLYRRSDKHVFIQFRARL